MGLEKSDPAELQPLEKGSRRIEDFDDILEIIGSNGKYQKIIIYGVIVPMVIICPLFVMNRIFMLSLPDHWCDVPGRPEGTGLDSWKNLTLPMETGPDGLERFSKCEMYGENETKVKCDKWSYDKSNYESTMPSEFNWVCDKAHYTADVFSISGFGNVLGTIVLGQLADKLGRKPIFFTTILIFIVFNTASLFVPHNFIAYLVLQFLAGTAFPYIFSAPTMIAAEISGKDSRAWIYSVAWMVWVIGNSLLPLIAWYIGKWFLLGIVTSIPAVFLLLYYNVVMESPRWLVSVRRTEDAAVIIQKMAKINGTFIHPDELKQALQYIVDKDKNKQTTNTKAVGIWTLFTKKRLAMNTILLCIAWAMNGLVYYGLTLNTTHMSGNEFFNYFILGIIELPAGYLSGVLVNKSGRRWTQALFFILGALSFAVASVSVFRPDLTWIVLVAACCAKFGCSVTSLVVYLQGTEIFPTQLRSTGSGLASTVSSIVGTTGPYIVYLGNFHAAAPYIVLTGLSLIGAVSSACLPETLNQNLPETIEDANKFGKNHKFWSFLPEEVNLKPKNELVKQQNKE